MGRRTFLTAAIGVLIFTPAGVGCTGRRAVPVPPYPFAYPKADAELLRRLQQTSPDHFHYSSVPDFAAQFGRVVGVGVTVSPEVAAVDARCNVRCGGLPADEMLKWVTWGCNIAWVIRDGRVIICSRDEAERDPFTARSRMLETLAEARRRFDAPMGEPPDLEHVLIEQKFKSQRLDLYFDEATIGEIVDFIRDFCQLNITFSEGFTRSGAIDELTSLEVQHATLEEIFAALGVVAELREKIILVMSKEEFAREQQQAPDKISQRRASLAQQIEVNYRSAPFFEAAQDLGRRAHLEVVMEEALWGATPRVTLAGSMTVEEALDALSRRAGARWTLEEGTVCFVKHP